MNLLCCTNSPSLLKVHSKCSVANVTAFEIGVESVGFKLDFSFLVPTLALFKGRRVL